MPLNGNHLDSGLTAGTRSAIISFVFICCSIICCNGCCQKQPHAGPQWHTWSPKLWSACWAAVPDSLRSPWHSAAGGKKRHYIVNSMKGTVSHVETSEGVCVWRRGRCVWLVSACRWCSCLDVSMRSDPDWTSSAQEPLPELINQLLQGTDVAVCVHACVGGVFFSSEFHVRLQHSFLKWSVNRTHHLQRTSGNVLVSVFFFPEHEEQMEKKQILE